MCETFWTLPPKTNRGTKYQWFFRQGKYLQTACLLTIRDLEAAKAPAQ
jgi:hypothetical protein